MGGGREEAGATSTSPKFDLFLPWVATHMLDNKLDSVQCTFALKTLYRLIFGHSTVHAKS